MSRPLNRIFLCLALALCAGALVLWPARAADAARQGLALCGSRVIPALFPFFVLSALTVDLGVAGALGKLLAPVMAPLFRLPGVCAAPWVLGLIGGYPVGARTAAALYQSGVLSKSDAQRTLTFCNACGPAFLLGVVGAGVFGEPRAGLLLWGTHALGALLTGLCFRGRSRPKGVVLAPPPGELSPKVTERAFPAAFSDAVRGACTGVLNVSAFVVLFTVIAALLPLSHLPPWPRVLLTGALEVTSGVCSLSFGAARLRLTAAAALLGWGGVCVHCQSISLLGELSAKPYLAGKALHGLFSAALTWLLAPLFPLSIPTAALSPLPLSPSPFWWLGWAAVIGLKILVEKGRKVW